ncbi:MAG TPA: hypothetical protein VFO81_03165, partial [Gaiellaceae bacterium]|nr:hypothetical protein [Gaiellaceae bacterium]
TTVNAAADLSIELSDTPDPARVRDRVQLRAELANAGPSVAAAEVLVELPDGLRLLSVDGGGDCRVERATVRCFFAGIDPGEHPAVVVSATTKQRGTLITSATVAPFFLADPVSANNHDTETTTVLR